MKMLITDIERFPNLGYHWGMYQQDIGLAQLKEPGSMCSFAAKWYGEPDTEFSSTFHNGKQEMLNHMHKLLDEADVVVGYNSTGFDVKHINEEFFLADMAPPAPFLQVDLFREIKKNFRMTSNKLAFVTKAVGLAGKEETGGFALWVACMNGDEGAWEKMKSYNIQDVVQTEALFDKMIPWIRTLPSNGLYDGDLDTCPRCGSADLERRGFAYTQMSKYQRFHCRACDGWSRSTKRIEGSTQRSVV